MSGRTDLKKSYNITGYISDVEFFSLNLNKYVIICQYYNKVVNSYDSSCAVIRISKENVCFAPRDEKVNFFQALVFRAQLAKFREFPQMERGWHTYYQQPKVSY